MSASSGDSFCSSPNQGDVEVRASLPVATVVGSFHLRCELHSRIGELGAYEKYSDPSECVKNGQAVENKPSIEGSEVEGARHHGLGNVKNSVVHRLGLGRGKHFAFTTKKETFWVCPETPSCL